MSLEQIEQELRRQLNMAKIIQSEIICKELEADGISTTHDEVIFVLRELASEGFCHIGGGPQKRSRPATAIAAWRDRESLLTEGLIT